MMTTKRKEGDLRNFKGERREKLFDRIENNDEHNEIIFLNNEETVYIIDYCQAVRSDVLGNRDGLPDMIVKKNSSQRA